MFLFWFVFLYAHGSDSYLYVTNLIRQWCLWRGGLKILVLHLLENLLFTLLLLIWKAKDRVSICFYFGSFTTIWIVILRAMINNWFGACHPKWKGWLSENPLFWWLLTLVVGFWGKMQQYFWWRISTEILDLSNLMVLVLKPRLCNLVCWRPGLHGPYQETSRISWQGLYFQSCATISSPRCSWML